MKRQNTILLKLDQKFYPKEAIITTCCQFLKDYYVFLEGKGDTKVTLTPKNTTVGLKKVKDNFTNELINNSLRYSISQRNKDVREYIVKTALGFSQANENTDNLLLEDFQTAQTKDWQSDPLGIAVPWEEKNKKKTKKRINSKK